MLQTAQAHALGKCKRGVRVLFDTGSHKPFITARAAGSLGLQILRKEWVAINTFGQQAIGCNLREIVHVGLAPVGGSKITCLETFVVPEISKFQNEHTEIARSDYLHLADTFRTFVGVKKD